MNRLPFAPVSRTLGFALALCLCSHLALAAPAKKHKRRNASLHATVVQRAATTSSQSATVRKASFTVPRAAGPVIAGGPWTEPTYADSTLGDNVDGEDLDIRRAAVA